MWHEARKREKATQKLLNDHKKRAEKRRGENRIDPNNFLQVHGIKAKLCLDPSVYKQAVKSLVVWQGDKSITIDRFDIRATLSSIPSDTTTPSQSSSQQNDKSKSTATNSRNNTVLDLDESESMKKILNYERYRLLIQSDLNKVPEELRLKLVSDNDVLSDAKMRKLRNNKFGTSGEASISTSQSYHVNNQKISQSRDTAKRGGAAIGYNYNSVPPPPCLSDTTFGETDTAQQSAEQGSSNSNFNASYMDILDLVDNDNFDLESVNVANLDAKFSDEIARKYSLSGDELLLLVKRDSHEAGGAADILRELDRLKSRLNIESSKLSGRHDNQVYGPALPPNLVASAGQDLHSPTSSSNSSPVRQRSPSGVADFTSRNGHSPSESGESLKSPESKSSKRKTEEENQSPSPDKPNTVSVSKELGEQSNGASSKDMVIIDITGKKGGGDRGSDRMSPRRAPTPLAYKRNCRSSRSLSREKHSRRRRSSHKRRRRTRSSSRSSSYSTTSSSPSSRSSRSSYTSRRTSRRKRRSRYRRD